MKGFELKYNDKVITASIENGVTSIFLSKVEDDIRLDFGGLDCCNNQHVTWFQSIIHEGDEMKIKIVDVTKVADVIKSKPRKKDSLENKLIEYRGIKKYLEKEGIIEKDE